MTGVLWERLRARFCEWTGILLPTRDSRNSITLATDLAQTRGMTLTDYLAHCDADSGSDERQRLIDRLTVNTTWFLRESGGVEALVRALARAAAVSGDATVRVWSAGCSTGQEPYALAMALVEAGLEPQILATDISRAALETASRARYSLEATKALPATWLARYTRPSGMQHVTIASTIRSRVTFELHNLARTRCPWRGRALDALMCCNVLIYFDRALCLEIVARMAGACKPDAFVLLGATERPLVWLTDLLTLDEETGTLLLRPTTEARRRRQLPLPSPQASHGAPPSPKARPLRPAAPSAPDRKSAPVARTVSAAPRATPTSAQKIVRDALARLDGDTGGWDHPTALAQMDALLAADVLLLPAHLLRGLALKSAGRVDEAIQAFRCARFLGGDDAWIAPYQLGLALEQVGELADACEAYRHASSIVRAGGSSGLALADGAEDGLMTTVAEACEARLAALLPKRVGK
jgi:chemotaxis methyl-accepting protein methylase